MLKSIKIAFIIGLIVILYTPGFGQVSFNSPYSGFGLGDLTFKGFGRNRAMGGITYGMRDSKSIDFANPAAYTIRDSLSLTFEFGGTGQASQFSTAEETNVPWDFNFSHLAFSFPVSRKLSFGSGLVPYSLISYFYVDPVREENDSYNPEIGEIDYLFKGDGGINQIFFGLGYEITKNFSVGVNVNYLFGNLHRTQSATFIDNLNAHHPKLEVWDIVSGFNFNFGLQYIAHFGEDYELVAGGSFIKGSNINQKTEFLYTNSLFVSDRGSVTDTLYDFTSPKEEKKFPASVGVGATINKGDKWLIGFDYKQVFWKNSNIMRLDSLLNSQSFHFGMEYTPNPREQKIYPLRIHYRIGAYYTKSYLKVMGNQINDFGITFGAGLPIGRSRSSVNIAFDLGRRGTREDNMILENHGAITLSLTLYDFWFMKRKYD